MEKLQGVNKNHIVSINLIDTSNDMTYHWRSEEIKIGKRGKPDKIIREAGIYNYGYGGMAAKITQTPENRYIKDGKQVWEYPKLYISLINKVILEFYFETYKEGCLFVQKNFKESNWIIESNFRPKLKQ